MVNFLDAHLFEIVILIVTAILIPIGLMIANRLGKILTNTNGIITTLTVVTQNLTEVTKEMTENRLRDKDVENQLENIRTEMQACKTDIYRKIDDLKK